MSTRRTTAERIDLQKEKMEQMQNEMKRLKRKQSEEARKSRNHRIIRRGSTLESLLPDTITLSDERFRTFLEKTVANKFGRDILATLKAEQDKEDAKTGANEMASGEAPAAKAETAGQSAAKPVAATPSSKADPPKVTGGDKTAND